VKLRFRHNTAIAVAAVLVLIAGVSLTTWAVWLLPLLLIPLAVAVWGWRAGTDVDAGGVTVRAAIGRRRVPWSQISEITTERGGRVAARLASGRMLRLTAVPASALPQLAQTAAGEVRDDDPR
jgi:hypothetical protein